VNNKSSTRRLKDEDHGSRKQAVLPFADSCLACTNNDSGIVRQVDGQNQQAMHDVLNFPIIISVSRVNANPRRPLSVVSTQRKQIKAKPNPAHQQTVPG
jgi:hypothetical protein